MPSETSNSRPSIYETITSKILAAIEQGPGDPIMPWQRSGARPVLPVNAATGQPYRGVNILSLWVTALERGYASGEWATLKRWNAKGAQVRKGEKASPIVFYREVDKTGDTATADDESQERYVLARGYWVFGAEQVDGYSAAANLPANPILRHAAAERYFAGMGARIVIGGAQAGYRPSTDTIHMPDEARFVGSDGRSREESWYGVLGHESCHWAGAPNRLARDFGKRYADDAHCLEEAYAECCAAFLCARFGFASEPHPDHARYIHHWLSAMRADSRALFAAAAKAQAAVGYLDSLQPDAALRAAA